MQEVTNGSKVHVHYTGRLKNGEMFDTSDGRDPLEFTAGSGMVIKGFDDAVIGMKPGEKKTVQIPVHEAYGEKNEQAIMQYALSEFPEGMEPEVGQELHLSDEEGNVVPVVITAIEDGRATLDANHPLAGQDLVFDIEVVRIGGSEL